jgi:polar amino acid transport system substrate-binding protein
MATPFDLLRVGFLLTTLSGIALAETVTLRADSYPPFNSDPAGQHPGVMIDLAKAVFTAKGYQVDYQLMPWPKAVEAVRTGAIDGAVAADEAGTAGLAYPKEPQGEWKPVFNVLAGTTWKYAGDASLNQVTIGVVQDYDYGNDPEGKSYNALFESNPEKIEVFKGNDASLLAVRALFAGKVQVIIEDPRVLKAVVQNHQLDASRLASAGASGSGYPLYIGFSPNERGRRLAQELSDGTAALRASGELGKILAVYGVTDWK